PAASRRRTGRAGLPAREIWSNDHPRERRGLRSMAKAHVSSAPQVSGPNPPVVLLGQCKSGQPYHCPFRLSSPFLIHAGRDPRMTMAQNASARSTAARAFVRSLNILLKFARMYDFGHPRTVKQHEIAWQELRTALGTEYQTGLLLAVSGEQLL